MFVFHKLFAFRFSAGSSGLWSRTPTGCLADSQLLRVVIFLKPPKNGVRIMQKKFREHSNQDSPTMSRVDHIKRVHFFALLQSMWHPAKAVSRILPDPMWRRLLWFVNTSLARKNAFIACPCKKTMGEDDPVLRVWVSVSFQGAKCSGKTLDFLSDILHEFDRWKHDSFNDRWLVWPFRKFN